MTICLNAISCSNDITILADCRLTYTYSNKSYSFTEHALKTYPIDNHSTISFSANDIDCVKFIMERIIPKHYDKKKEKGEFHKLLQISRQAKHFYKQFYNKTHKKPEIVSFIFGSYVDTPIIARCKSPDFKIEHINTTNSCLVIGGSENLQNELSKSISTLLNNTKQFGSDFQFAATYGLLKRDIEESDEYKKKFIGGIFTEFRILKDTGVRVFTKTISQYMGSLSEANDGKGYARTNEVEFDESKSVFFIHDHQNSKRIPLQNIFDLKYTNEGIIKTKFSYKELKKN